MSGSDSTAIRGARRFFLPPLLAIPLVLGACATAASNPFEEATSLDLYVLRVESQNIYDVSIYLNPSRRRELLGTVQRNGLEYFEFEYPAGRLLHIELENTVGDRYRIPPPPLTVGGRLELYVSSTLRRSAYRTR